MEGQLGPGPWFADDRFGLVDAVFAPVFRYFDTFDRIGDFGVLDGLTGDAGLASRHWPSGRRCGTQSRADYHDRLADFLRRKDSALSRLMEHSCIALRQTA